MKTIIPSKEKMRFFARFKIFIILFLLALSITSCVKQEPYPDGRSGRAYLSLTYTEVEPAYIEPGTTAIPETFYWGDYYRAYPGFYSLYYETDTWNGYEWEINAWEVDYEIWQTAGERGTYDRYGRDGRDTHFSIDMAPFGPLVDRPSKGDTNDELADGYKIIDQNTDSFVVQKEENEFGIKLNYRKVEPRKRKKE